MPPSACRTEVAVKALLPYDERQALVLESCLQELYTKGLVGLANSSIPAYASDYTEAFEEVMSQCLPRRFSGMRSQRHLLMQAYRKKRWATLDASPY